jgi:hypothetical protein
MTLILVRISQTVCRPSTNLPALDHTTHHCQQWVTPEMGLNSTRVKGFLTRLKVHRQHERLCHRCQPKLTAYSPSFPTFLSHPGSVPLFFSTFLQLLHFQQVGQEVSKPYSYSLAPFRKSTPRNSLTHRISHGPDNLPLQYPTGPDNPLLQSNSQANQIHQQKMAMDNGLGTVMKI